MVEPVWIFFGEYSEVILQLKQLEDKMVITTIIESLLYDRHCIFLLIHSVSITKIATI